MYLGRQKQKCKIHQIYGKVTFWISLIPFLLFSSNTIELKPQNIYMA